MIGKLRGVIDTYGDDFVVIDVHGVGYVVHCSARTLQSLPPAGEAATISIETHVREQEIKLFVKPKAGHAFDHKAFSEWLGQRLAPFQNPRYVAVVDDFDRTPSQRIMKHRLSTSLENVWDRSRGTVV